MKKKFLLFFTAFIIMAVLPFLSLGTVKDALTPDSGESLTGQISSENKTAQQSDSSSESDKSSKENSFIILDTSTNKKVEIDDKTFCIGAVAYEMPPSFESEALKAQCVACYTHFCRLRQQQRANPDKSLDGADFAADLSKGEYYLSDTILQEKWGGLYDESKEKLTAAVNDVFGEVLTDNDGNYIDAAYHAISNGETENAEDIFGNADSHLVSVASPGDKLAPGYKTEYEISDSEFKEKILSLDKSADFSGSSDQWTGKTERTKAGTVKSIVIGSKTFTGADIRELFSLRSAGFSITHSDNTFTFTVLGYGHGVGLSQYGADYMAQQGSTYRQILTHYYSEIQFTIHNS